MMSRAPEQIRELGDTLCAFSLMGDILDQAPRRSVLYNAARIGRQRDHPTSY
ncbi:hypothetical protein Poly21_20030 [Allorhodopirellula heiligendammensis]|uniref:Uncharacterized protein n=1 Tax=Allorhodopirellula heiligendammensis TaxID=2714739 RepID=A0A5C6C6T4_9BACT|nr:hypothetical protein Poly21_20030 [Allorhodopirellula heiligendammensis]